MAFPQMHTIYGRAIGVMPSGHPTSQYGWADNVAAATSATTGTNLQNYGINTFVVSTLSTSKTFTLPAPVPGVWVQLFNAATASTQSFSVKLESSSYFMVGGATSPVITLGSSYNNVALTRPGAVVSLVGISTKYYAVIGCVGFSTADTPFTVV